MTPPGGPSSVFVSYSHRDQEWLERLQVHLKPLERAGTLAIWDDTRIAAGQAWNEEIRRALAEAAVAVLLVSADFLASDFIAGQELPPLLEATERHGIPVLPLFLSPCRIASVPALERLQGLNSPDRPLIGLGRTEQEALFVRLAEAVHAVLTSPETVLREKIRRRFREIEAQHRITGEPGTAAALAFVFSPQRAALLAKKMFLLTELGALVGFSGRDPALRTIVEREIAVVNQELKRSEEPRQPDLGDILKISKTNP
jgi:hypothetical protein